MDWKQDKQQTVTRLAVCVVIAVVLYVAAEKFGGGIPQLAPYRPWLEKNKVQAIAVVAAVLFGVSLAVLPLTQAPQAAPTPPGDGEDPCGGYEAVDPGF